MMEVWKYILTDAEGTEIEMPKGAKIIHFDTQHGMPCIWVLVDPKAPKEIRKFKVYGTGHEITDKIISHIGKVLIAEGNLVFHAFEIQTEVKT